MEMDQNSSEIGEGAQTQQQPRTGYHARINRIKKKQNQTQNQSYTLDMCGSSTPP